MRTLLITAAFVLVAGTAAAASIEDVVSGAAVNSSVATVSCAHCPALQPKKETYVVPALEPGTDRVELKEIDGEVKAIRTEAWLGGSPVVFVSRASQDEIKAAAMAAEQPSLAQTGPGAASAEIDETAKTSAVSILTQAQPVNASLAGTGSREFDPAAFALRLD